MKTLGFWFVILIWLLPIALVIIRRRQLKKRREYPGLQAGPPVSIFQDFSRNKFEDSFDRAANAGEVWQWSPEMQVAKARFDFTRPYHPGVCAEGCETCHGYELPCFCECHGRSAA